MMGTQHRELLQQRHRIPAWVCLGARDRHARPSLGQANPRPQPLVRCTASAEAHDIVVVLVLPFSERFASQSYANSYLLEIIRPELSRRIPEKCCFLSEGG